MPIMLEFWKDGVLKKIYVTFNRETMSLNTFLTHPEAKIIIELMYKKIQDDYSTELKDTVVRTVGEFIRTHFLRLDKTFDVVVLGIGDKKSIIFNFDRDRTDDIT